MDNKFVCCLCGKTVNGWGNNPWPLNNDPKAECCDVCNETKVIPARLLNILNHKEESE